MSDDKIIDLEQARIQRLPMLDLDLDSLQSLVQSFTNQLVAMGHRELAASFPVGKYQAKIVVEITENHD